MRPVARARRLVLAAWLVTGVAHADAGGASGRDASGGAPVVEYLTLAANEGGASGGHAALRLGERVFHFEVVAGRLRLARERWPDFRFRYRVLENRALRAQRLDAGADVAAVLERHFDRRLWSETLERDRLRTLEADVRLLEALADTSAPATVPVPGAGFFGTAAASERSAALDALRRRIARERGSDFAPRRLGEVRAALRALAAGPDAPHGGNAAGLSRRVVELLAAERALAALRDAPRLRTSALAALPADVAPLSAAERRSLGRRRKALETELVRLVGSQRPDWGSAFALGLARLAALAESERVGRLVVLDALGPDAPRVEAAVVRRATGPLARHQARRRAELAQLRGLLAGEEGFDERAHARLERAASRVAELHRALGQGVGLRLAGGARSPLGVAPLPVAAALRALPPAALEGPLASARARLAAARAALEARRGYDLVGNNCVTAIFREVAAAMAGRPDRIDRPAARVARRPLDRTVRALRFVPAVAARVVARDWRVSATRTLPSHRREGLRTLRACGPRWLVGLRESNTFTSTLYEPSPRDSVFVFFTDGRVWSRPLLGAVNLAAGLVHGAAGLLWLPFDRGEHLVRGLRGAAASVPELAFVNVRKGSFPFALPPARVGAGDDAPRRPACGGTAGG